MTNVLAARAGRPARSWMPFVVVAAAAAAALGLAFGVFTISSPDFARFVWQADHLSTRDAWTWVNPFHPLGYPLALRVLVRFTGDHLITARAINGAAAVAALVACWRIASALHERMAAAVFGVIAVALSREFVTGIRTESPDMPMAAAALWSVALLVGPRTHRRLLLAGAAAGLAYLFRYQGLIVLVIGLVLGGLVSRRPGEEPGTGRYRTSAGLFILGFVLAAFPQFVVSWVASGNPLYNLQEINAGMALWGVDWHDFRRSTDAYTPGYVLTHDIGAFFGRWGLALARELNGLGAFAVAIVLPAWLLESTARRARVALFVAGAALLYVLAMSSGFYRPADAIVSAALLRMLISGTGALWLTHSRRSSYRLRVAALVGVTFAAWITVDVIRDLRDLRSVRLTHQENEEISKTLHDQGLTDPAQVLTTSLDWHDTLDAGRRSFYTYGGALQLDPAWTAAFPRPEISDLSSLDRFAAAHGICFLLLSTDADRVMPDIAASAARASLAAAFTLVWRDGARSIWRYRACGAVRKS